MGILVFCVFVNVWVFVVVIGVIVGVIFVVCDGVFLVFGFFGFLVFVIVFMGGFDSFVGVFILVMVVGIFEVLV